MEAVNSLAGAAANAVWGNGKETGQEPVSGKTGDTSKGEPYDAGNMENPPLSPTSPTDGAKPVDFPSTTGTATESTDAAKPSTDVKSGDAPADSNTSKADDDGVNEGQKLEGAGPRPIEDVAREHGGDAGQVDAKPAPEGVDGGEKKDEAQKEAEKGDGTKLVKASGLQADGGDFDATKPGAGREADRLMEQKGISNPNAPAEPKQSSPQTPPAQLKSEDSVDTKASSGSGESGKKRGLREKIKEKLGRKSDVGGK